MTFEARKCLHQVDGETGRLGLHPPVASPACCRIADHIAPLGGSFGIYGDKGKTLRRHVQMSGARYIGKESNDWEAQAVLGFDPHAAPSYGISACELATFPERLAHLSKIQGTKTVAERLRLPRSAFAQIKLAKGDWENASYKISPILLSQLEMEVSSIIAVRQSELDELTKVVDLEGWRNMTIKLERDPSNSRRSRVRRRKI